MGSRTWIKIYCNKWLQGTIRKESVLVRAVWVDLLVLAGSMQYSDIGTIAITPMVGISDVKLCKILGVSRQAWVFAKQRLIDTERITIDKENVIIINNWSKYQSEYQRIKSTTKYTPKSTPIEVEVKEVDREVEKSTPFNPKYGTPIKQEATYCCPYCSKSQNKPVSHFYPKTDMTHIECYKKLMKERTQDNMSRIDGIIIEQFNKDKPPPKPTEIHEADFEEVIIDKRKKELNKQKETIDETKPPETPDLEPF